NDALRSDPERLKADLDKAGISRDRYDAMRNPDGDGDRVPLCFTSREQYLQFKAEFATMVDGIKVGGKPVSAQGKVIGSASTFYSNNPTKDVGHHYDRKGPQTGDVDVDLFSPEMVQQMLGRPDAVANDKVMTAGEKTIFKSGGAGGLHSEFPQVK